MIDAVGPVGTLLDLCAGTGEIALGYLARHADARAILVDFCPEMLAVAEQKGAPLRERFTPLACDVEAIPLPSHSVDAVTIAYGVRNLAQPRRCFREGGRLLKPGGRLLILELTRPSSSLLATLHRLYLRYLLPLFGYGVTGQRQAYSYLSESISAFATPEEVEELLRQEGLTPIERKSFCAGAATLFIARSPL